MRSWLYWLLRRLEYQLLVHQTGQIRAPVLVTKSGIVIDGNRRVLRARQRGEQVRIVRIDAEPEWVDPDDLIVSCGIGHDNDPY